MQWIGLTKFFHGVAVSPKWGGVAQINSGDGIAVVSASNINSGFPIFVQAVGSGSSLHSLRVDSIVSGVSMAVTPNSGNATGTIPFGWMALK